MSQISLSSREIRFIRQLLIFAEHHYAEQVALDRRLLDSPLCGDSKSLYGKLLRDDLDNLNMAKSLYSKIFY